MGRLKKLIIAIVTTLLVSTYAWANGITELGASQIGDNTAKAIHFELERFDRTVTLFESPENNILPSGSDSEPVQRIRQRLVNHTYWAVRYLPKDHKDRDDELAIFIDSTTGAILGIYTGE